MEMKNAARGGDKNHRIKDRVCVKAEEYCPLKGFEVKEGYSKSPYDRDLICEPCKNGYYNDGTETSCQEKGPCEKGEEPNPAEVRSHTDKSMDISCSACPDDHYKDKDGNFECMRHVPCKEGQGVKEAGDKKQNIVCKECEKGKEISGYEDKADGEIPDLKCYRWNICDKGNETMFEGEGKLPNKYSE